MGKVTITEIKRLYPSLQKWDDVYAYELYKKIEEHQLIVEFLSTVSMEKTIEQFDKLSYKKQLNASADEYDSDKIKVVFSTLEASNLKEVNSFMDKFGWYPATIEPYTKKGGKYTSNVDKFFGKTHVIILYEAKYDKEAKHVPKFVYHITPDIKWPKIKVLGLTPKTQGKLADHPGRVYVLEGTSELEEIAFMLYNAYPQKDLVKEMYVLKIDTSQIPDAKFFDDPNFFAGDGAIWTYQNIPPSSIQLINKINTSH